MARTPATIRRLPEKSVDDRAVIDAILDEGFVCHVAYLIDGRPVVIPTLYVRDGDTLPAPWVDRVGDRRRGAPGITAQRRRDTRRRAGGGPERVRILGQLPIRRHPWTSAPSSRGTPTHEPWT